MGEEPNGLAGQAAHVMFAFLASLLVTGSLVLAGTFGFQPGGAAADAANPLAEWKERQALCQDRAADRDASLCDVLPAEEAPAAP
jgi:hypothetical protein